MLTELGDYRKPWLALCQVIFTENKLIVFLSLILLIYSDILIHSFKKINQQYHRIWASEFGGVYGIQYRVFFVFIQSKMFALFFHFSNLGSIRQYFISKIINGQTSQWNIIHLIYMLYIIKPLLK